ncbi:hypothetical protein Lal_00020261 [Lupinus albus]|nr:hypothetical protein Lal_00020261 [Lupinus albus]
MALTLSSVGSRIKMPHDDYNRAPQTWKWNQRNEKMPFIIQLLFQLFIHGKQLSCFITPQYRSAVLFLKI